MTGFPLPCYHLDTCHFDLVSSFAPHVGVVGRKHHKPQIGYVFSSFFRYVCVHLICSTCSVHTPVHVVVFASHPLRAVCCVGCRNVGTGKTFAVQKNFYPIVLFDHSFECLLWLVVLCCHPYGTRNSTADAMYRWSEAIMPRLAPLSQHLRFLSTGIYRR